MGHSSHVTNVRFTQDKSRVISIGGADHAIFQWRFIPENSTDKAAAAQESVPEEETDRGTPKVTHQQGNIFFFFF